MSLEIKYINLIQKRFFYPGILLTKTYLFFRKPDVCTNQKNKYPTKNMFGYLLFEKHQAKSSKSFEEWIAQLRHHRLYRQHEISFGSFEAPKYIQLNSPVDESSPLMTSPMSPGSPGKCLNFVFLRNAVVVMFFVWMRINLPEIQPMLDTGICTIITDLCKL